MPRDHTRTSARPQAAFTSHSLSGANAQSPSTLTPAERLDEVGRILAAGIMRARAKRLQSQEQFSDNNGDVSLDLAVKESGHVRTKTRHREK